ncbi:tautomerase family protein [Denitromonas ohlonensis]|jgi:4-oxalocrotonate tautomerase|uniref:4-oxalocrotonate tautomerase n=2 Tax=Denitromonas TaxID=139331 RepID=A0A558CQ70_9RHOO|nr:tautomerase family protein [Denitromonas ohlonensis]TVO67051.1 4-oxalocrotonate tautomerase [Denitromonas ohlonensis]TVO79111.1 4-oxalocrotonate tautomerase [Denitromonas ohlonensis]TVT50792.1 MAG: 4-oxalocrotonate tautomerase [Denitromonas halophila]TVT74714.1 MAG: 4-oxalocrotonate tautomerase [Denitromonas halophila]
MPLVDIHVIEGVFSPEQKKDMIAKVTDTMVGIEGENLRGVTWVRVLEVASGSWGIGGQALTAADVKAIQSGAS